MLLSMTGFGKATVQTPSGKVNIEIKSLNSKQVDLAVRIPHALRGVELEVRRRVAERLGRGKIDVFVTLQQTKQPSHLALNVEAIKTYHAQIAEMTTQLDLPQPSDWQSLLLRLPDALVDTDEDREVDAELLQALYSALDNALDAITDFRRTEGSKLEGFFAQRIKRIAELLKEIEPWEKERVPKIKQRIEDALNELKQVDVDRARLEQEMIFYIEKLDVTEEKQRLATHLRYFLETMDSNVSQGKKLGFIAQEIGREINTLGSKSNHALMQQQVVKMKDELEQIKEQVLNVL